jgi:hypothetical protein
VRAALSMRSMRASVTPTGLGRCGDRVANTPSFCFSMGSVILALNVERVLLNALDSFRVLVFK